MQNYTNFAIYLIISWEISHRMNDVGFYAEKNSFCVSNMSKMVIKILTPMSKGYTTELGTENWGFLTLRIANCQMYSNLKFEYIITDK